MAPTRSGPPVLAWTSLVPFAVGQELALEIRKFVFTIKGNGRLTALTGGTVGIHMHVPPQLGVDEVTLDLTLTARGAEAGNGLRLDRTRKGTARRTEHDDVRMTALAGGRVRVERAAIAGDERTMAFTIGRGPAGLVIADIAGFGQLDGATITLRAG